MNPFLEALSQYRKNCETLWSPEHREQAALVTQFEELAAEGEKSLTRSHLHAHFTGSVLVANPSLDAVLLTHHAKLGLWLQLGGHADGDVDLAAVALREGQEESGIKEIRFFPLADIFDSESATQTIFDLDIHKIPARQTEPEHRHYDVRYLALTESERPLTLTPESNELRWIPLSDAYGLTAEPSMHRQFDKLAWVRKNWVRA